MLINERTAISSPNILLVPYGKSHVPTYHNWMKSEEIQESTASELLSLEEEFAMQASWRNDRDKLTFIVCIPSETIQFYVTAGSQDSPEAMIGDVNLFLFPADDDPEACIGELELMIAPLEARRHGYGRTAILALIQYIQLHLDEIIYEYGGPSVQKLAQLKVKIGSKNEKSIRLFESIEFLKVNEEPDYFGEFELVLHGFPGEKRCKDLLKKHGTGRFIELPYVDI